MKRWYLRTGRDVSALLRPHRQSAGPRPLLAPLDPLVTFGSRRPALLFLLSFSLFFFCFFFLFFFLLSSLFFPFFFFFWFFVSFFLFFFCSSLFWHPASSEPPFAPSAATSAAEQTTQQDRAFSRSAASPRRPTRSFHSSRVFLSTSVVLVENVARSDSLAHPRRAEHRSDEAEGDCERRGQRP